MIELLGALVVHAGFLNARRGNLRLDHMGQPLAWGAKVCHHGRAVTHSCWSCPREIATQRWIDWAVFRRLRQFVGQPMTPELRESIIGEVHDTIKGVTS